MNDDIDPAALAVYWKDHVDTWKGSGLSQIKFCQANALSYHRFVYWRRKFERDTEPRQAKSDSGGFAEVNCRPEANSGLTLSLPNGLVIRGICSDTVPVVRQLLEQL